MKNADLIQAVEQFARRTQAIPELNLERAWAWQSYDSEGIRFAFFRTYEELREVAVRLRAQRAPLTQAQNILAGHEAAYWDLQAAVLGIENGLEEQVPCEGEWSVRRTFAHILGAELGFYAVIRYSLGGLRLADGRPDHMAREAFAATSGVDGATFEAVMAGPWEKLREFYRDLHQRVLCEFATLSDDELEAPSFYWENEPMSLRFRLHRLDAHARQHTIQIDKTLLAIGQPPNEAKRLLRLIYTALADVNSTLLGAPDTGESLRQSLAAAIRERGDEIARIGTENG